MTKSEKLIGRDASPRSQASAIYREIRRDIVAGKLAPGLRLKINELSDAYQVSSGAVREALCRMVPERLVISRDQIGFRVAPLSKEDLLELTDLRCEVEAIALRRSVAQGGIDWEANIVAAAHRLKATRQAMSESDATLNPAWIDAHALFHAALVSACGNARLIALHASLYEQAARYRGLSAHLKKSRAVADEHEALIDAALSRDVEKLTESATAHIRQTALVVVPTISDPVPII